MSSVLDTMKYAELADAGYSGGLAPLGWEVIAVNDWNVPYKLDTY